MAEQKIEFSNRPTAEDEETLQDLLFLGPPFENEADEDFADNLLMCIEEGTKWTTQQATAFDELLKKLNA